MAQHYWRCRYCKTVWEDDDAEVVADAAFNHPCYVVLRDATWEIDKQFLPNGAS